MTRQNLLDSIDEHIGLTDSQKITIDNLVFQYEQDLQSACIIATSIKLNDMVKLGFQIGSGAI